MNRLTRRSFTLATVLGLAALALTMPATAASADAALAEANPAEGEILDTAPTEIRLVFNEELLEQGSHGIEVIGPDGEEVTTGEATIEDSTMSIALNAETEGAYTVTWQAVSIDSHTISDTYQFGIGAGVVLEESDHTEEADASGGLTEALWLIVIVVSAVLAVLAAILLIWFFASRRRARASRTE